MQVTYNLNKPKMSRVVDVMVRCLECRIPSYSPLRLDSTYNVLMSTFLIGGGDGYKFEPLEHFLYSKYNIYLHSKTGFKFSLTVLISCNIHTHSHFHGIMHILFDKYSSKYKLKKKLIKYFENINIFPIS